jgi:ribosomal protein S18 acetylase RimI-like enzyme
VRAVDIRTPEPGDADALVDLWVALASGQQEYGSHLRAGPNRSRVRDVLARYAATDRLLVALAPSTATDTDSSSIADDTDSSSIADDTDQETDIVGFVMFRIRADDYEVDRERGLVENLFVVPDCRGEGVGSDLLSAAEAQLRERGVEAISLEAMAENHAARRFYRRHGYEPHRVEFEKSLTDR